MRFIVILILFVTLLFPLLLVGQPGPGDCNPGDPGYPDCFPRAPITEAIILLLAGAIGFGIKTFSKKNKK